MPDTRPRISFNEEGKCNACQWANEKTTAIPWHERQSELSALHNQIANRNRGKFDCIVPVSGGKDSCYVALRVQQTGFHPLAATVHPPLAFDIGTTNLEHFIEKGFDHIRITPNYEIGRLIARKTLIEQGQPLMAWIIAVQTAMFRLSVLFDVPLVMFGEEGETEYGGSSKLKNRIGYNMAESVGFYLSGTNLDQLNKDFDTKALYWWLYPSESELSNLNPTIAHWSYFENWDSYRNYVVAKKYFGLEERPDRSVGTYTNFAQTDTMLYDLHCYLMYLKFGFGRCTQDVGIDIRRGALTRRQALSLVREYDGEYPEAYISAYLRYFNMSLDEFEQVLDRFANKDLFTKINGRWKPIFTPS